MTEEEFYGDALPALKAAENQLLELVQSCGAEYGEKTGFRLVQHCCSRIKSPESMKKKLSGRGLPQTCEAALTRVNDALGVRVICSFIDDVYRVTEWLKNRPELSVIKTKDYIAYPKPNGYRGYHLIVKILSGPGAGVTAEIQLRTIALDFWACLEHQMKYKKRIEHEALIQSELKRCADEIASVDLSMQTIRDLLEKSF